MNMITKVLDLGVAVVSLMFLGLLAVNTIGVILFCAAVGLFLSGAFVFAIPVGILGMYMVIKTDDKL